MSFICDIYLSNSALFLPQACVDGVREYVNEQNRKKKSTSCLCGFSILTREEEGGGIYIYIKVKHVA